MAGVDRPMLRLTTAELSKRRWSDCAEFFATVESGWCACMLPRRGRHLPSTPEFQSREAVLEQNLRDLKELVGKGQAHGILVYADGDPVGWCEYGPVDELPVPPAERSARLPDSQWRITCFLTRLKFRRRGVAHAALSAAVESIRGQGGGQIEATPAVAIHHDPQLWKLRKTYGWRSDEVEAHLRSWPRVDVPGVGRVEASHGGPRAGSHQGIMSMFTRLGFEPVMRDINPNQDQWWIPNYRSHVVMRLRATPAR